MWKTDDIRRANGIATLVLMTVLAMHELAGALFINGVALGGARWLVWAGVVVIVVHVALSVGTTYRMLCDRVRPPSTKKKRHQVKKWVTGLAVAALVVVHMPVVASGASWSLIALLLDIALAVHLCVSAKSLVKDMGLASSMRFAVRAFAITVAAFAGIGICVALFA